MITISKKRVKLVLLDDPDEILTNANGTITQYFSLEDLLLLRKKVNKSILFARKNNIEKINQKLEDRFWIEEAQKPLVSKKFEKLGFVYIMIDRALSYENCKIGFSKSAEQREKTLQAEKPTIELVYAVPGTVSLEKQTHSHFSQYRIRGEWFKIDPNVVVDYLGQESFLP